MPRFIFDPGMFASFLPLIPLVAAWSLFWKGWALWKSARQGDKKWFVALFLINTLGILEILYIYVFSERLKKASSELGNDKKDS